MSVLGKFEHPQKMQNMEHFSHLVQVALADGTMSDPEFQLLRRIGITLGFTDVEIDALMESVKVAPYAPHIDLSKRFGQMFEIVQMVAADGEIESAEMQVATRLAIKSGFNEIEIPYLLSLLIAGIEKGLDEEELLSEYKKGRRAIIERGKI